MLLQCFQVPLENKSIFSGMLLQYIEENKKWRNRFLFVPDSYTISYYESKQVTCIWGVQEQRQFIYIHIHTGDKWGKNTQKKHQRCVSKVFVHHALWEELQYALAFILQVSGTVREWWTPFFQKIFPQVIFWWWRYRLQSNSSAGNLQYVFNMVVIWLLWRL